MPDGSRGVGTLVVLVTCPNLRVGETIGRTLVHERLAACVNVIPGGEILARVALPALPEDGERE